MPSWLSEAINFVGPAIGIVLLMVGTYRAGSAFKARHRKMTELVRGGGIALAGAGMLMLAAAFPYRSTAGLWVGWIAAMGLVLRDILRSRRP